MKIFESKILIGFLCFLVGIGAVLAAQKLLVPPKKELVFASGMKPMLDQFYDDEFFSRSRDPFEQMRKMRNRMIKEFDGSNPGGLFDSWYQGRFGGGDVAEIKKREDKGFVYYDIAIPGLDPKNLKVRVQNGQINVSGKIEKKTEEEGNSSFVSSSFHRSFPAPPEVDSNRVEIEQADGQVTLKFPRQG
ncbi:MAG: Hsp20/alpha crystallin family protein [Bdellovibrionales bacterium]|nr:Hsp20/alpha crystallin family protein [Bdellovibrionales bacterium]